MRTPPCLALTLLLAAVPLHAQGAGMHRVHAGSFSLEVPAYIPGLDRVHEGEIAGHRFEMFGGGHVDESVVLVQQGRAAEFSTDTAGMRAGLVRFYHDTALVTRYLHALSDSAHPEHGEIVRVLRDTTLATRRWILHQYRGMWASRNPPGWIVAHAAQRRTAAFDQATERLLDSFRITGARP